MNKAFVREPDNVDPVCPACGAPGEQVPRETLAAQVDAKGVGTLDSPAYFCLTPSCPVAYFDALENSLPVTALLVPRYPKAVSAPICPCFGLTLNEIDEDIREGHPARIRDLLAKSKTAAAQCLTNSPTGRCCLPEVQRLYFRRQAELKRFE